MSEEPWKKETKRYPMTVYKHLDKVALSIVEGDKHFGGNRNKFYIEAIELHVVRILGADALIPDLFDKMVKSESESSSLPPEKTVESDNPLLRDEKTPAPIIPLEETPPAPKQGKKARLEWRDGAIRDEHNRIYEITWGPKMEPTENREQHFGRCRVIKGVIFEVLSKKIEKNPLNNRVIVGT